MDKFISVLVVLILLWGFRQWAKEIEKRIERLEKDR